MEIDGSIEQTVFDRPLISITIDITCESPIMKV